MYSGSVIKGKDKVDMIRHDNIFIDRYVRFGVKIHQSIFYILSDLR